MRKEKSNNKEKKNKRTKNKEEKIVTLDDFRKNK